MKKIYHPVHIKRHELRIKSSSYEIYLIRMVDSILLGTPCIRVLPFFQSRYTHSHVYVHGGERFIAYVCRTEAAAVRQL